MIMSNWCRFGRLAAAIAVFACALGTGGAEANTIPDIRCSANNEGHLFVPASGDSSFAPSRQGFAPALAECVEVAAVLNGLNGVEGVICNLRALAWKPLKDDDGGPAGTLTKCQEVAAVLNGLNGVANVDCNGDRLAIKDDCEANAVALTRHLNGNPIDSACETGANGEACQHGWATGTCWLPATCAVGGRQPQYSGGCGCDCKAGYSGSNCETACAPGYSGPNCETACARQTGANGEACQHGRATGTGSVGCGCDCKAGYSGSNCETADKCQAGLNGAVCQNQGSATGVTGGCGCMCSAELAYSGPNCETADACKAGCVSTAVAITCGEGTTLNADETGCISTTGNQAELHICPYTTDTCDDTTSLTLAECRVFSESIKRTASWKFYGDWNYLPSGCQFYSYPSEYRERVGANRVIWNAFEGNENVHNQMRKASNVCGDTSHWCYASSSKRVCSKCVRDPTAEQLTSGVITGTLEEGSMGMGAVEAGNRQDAAAKLPAAAASGCSNDSSDADIARTVFEGVIAACLLFIAYTYGARKASAAEAQHDDRRPSDDQCLGPQHMISEL